MPGEGCWLAVRILGLSAYYHDASAALVEGGAISSAAHEERFTRVKHDARFPAAAAAWCLAHAGLQANDLDAVVFYDKPLLKLERVLEAHAAAAPRGLSSFVRAAPAWLREKLLLRTTLTAALRRLGARRPHLLFSEHHLSHAASAFFPSPFDEAAVLTIDGVGEWTTAAIWHGRGADLKVLRELHFPDSLGLFYSAVTAYLGFKVNSGEYKVMGLGAFARDEERTASLRRTLEQRFVSLRDDGSLRLAPELFDFVSTRRMSRDLAWARHLGFPPRRPEGPILPEHQALARAAQELTEEAVIRMARTARGLTGARALCLAGGLALNCVANRRLLDAGIFDELWIQPAAGDAGGALGAALAVHHLRLGGPRHPDGARDSMAGARLGPDIQEAEVDQVVADRGAVAEPHRTLAEVVEAAARLLAEGQVVAWARGRAEFGPRALGARSILADPRAPGMAERLNRVVKRREPFRPFAPMVLAEEACAHFDLSVASPYMLQVARVRGGGLPAVTHVDGTARVQTVDRAGDPVLANLLERFRVHSGVPVLVNTSFNVRGEPPVSSARDAYRCFMSTGLDALVLGDRLFLKARQPVWPGVEASATSWRPD
jgi:carbamoyltransferase